MVGKGSGRNHRQDGESSRSESQFTQRVLTVVGDEFVAITQDHNESINLHFGTGKQLTAAMFAWSRVIPRELKLKLLLWATGLEPYDPASAELIKQALQDARKAQPGGSGA